MTSNKTCRTAGGRETLELITAEDDKNLPLSIFNSRFCSIIITPHYTLIILPTYCLDRSEDHQHRDQQEHPQQHSDVVCVGNLFNIIAEQHLITTFVNLLASSSSSSCASAYIYFLRWAFIFSTYCLPTFSPHCTIHCTLALHFLTRPPPFGNSKRHGALAMALQKLGYNCTFARAVILFFIIIII